MPHFHILGGEPEPGRAAAVVVEHFELILRDGKSLGGVGLERPEWPLTVLIDRDGKQLRVIEVIDRDGPNARRILVVEPA